MKYQLIYVTAKDQAEARKIGEALVKEKLAACTNFFPINSLYRWEGKIEENQEYALLIKTKETLVDPTIKKIKEMHSYQIPCILCLNIEKGNEEFLNWIEKETK